MPIIRYSVYYRQWWGEQWVDQEDRTMSKLEKIAWEVGEVALFVIQWAVLLGGTAWIARACGVW